MCLLAVGIAGHYDIGGVRLSCLDEGGSKEGLPRTFAPVRFIDDEISESQKLYREKLIAYQGYEADQLAPLITTVMSEQRYQFRGFAVIHQGKILVCDHVSRRVELFSELIDGGKML